MNKKCLNCGDEFEQPKGKREKMFCSDNCRASYNQKNKSKFVRVPRDEWNKTQEEKGKPKIKVTTETQKSNYIINTKKVLKAESIPEFQKSIDDMPQKDKDRIDNSFKESILKQIADIRAEKMPDHRNTSIGRKSWAIEQNNRIKELKDKLNKQ